MVGIPDPFEDIRGLIYQTTMRAFGCEEVVSDPSYVLAYLAANRDWLARARVEVEAAYAAHTSDDESLSPIERLMKLPLEGWERYFPVLDACLQESIRISALGAGFHRNLGPDVQIGDEVVSLGACVAYHW